MASKQQSKLQQYFQSFRNSNESHVVGVENVQTGVGSDKLREGLKRSAEDECKENMPPGSINTMPGKKLPTATGASQSLGKSSKQMFLDLGQKDFGASKCSICGMVYAKGHEDDEKLHKSFHQSAVQGLRFQGWGQERVVLSDPFTGRLLMIMPSDPAAHVKRAQEVCAFVEKAHGITSGWLMSSKHCKVFLFVSLQKRIVGLAVVEPIKQAYRAAATAGPHNEEADSLQPAQQQQQSLQTQPQTFQQVLQQRQQQNQQQQRPPPLQWPGLHRSSSSRRPGGGNSLLLSAGAGTAAAADSTAAGSDAVKADSCPPSLLAAAGHMHVDSCMTAAQPEQQQQQQLCSQGLSMQQPQQQQASSTSDASVCRGRSQAAVFAEQSAPQTAALQDQMLNSSNQRPTQAQQQQQQQQQQCEMPPPPSQPVSSSAGARSACGSRSTAGGSGKCASSGGRAAGAAAYGGGGAKSSSRSFVAGGTSSGVQGGGGGCVVADRSKALRAMLGVRMVWVSADQRHKGLATKLLDAARCNMIPGYVVPRNQMAFMQPTEEGSKLAISFTGAQQFLLYGIE